MTLLGGMDSIAGEQRLVRTAARSGHCGAEIHEWTLRFSGHAPHEVQVEVVVANRVLGTRRESRLHQIRRDLAVRAYIDSGFSEEVAENLRAGCRRMHEDQTKMIRKLGFLA